MIRRLMIVNMILSIGYIVLMFAFVSQGASGKFPAQIMRMGYGMTLFIVGVKLMQALVGPKELQALVGSKYFTSAKETILDEDLEAPVINEKNRKGVRIDFFISCLHLSIALFMVIGEVILGIDYSTMMVIAFVYATLLVILGLGQFS